MLNYPVTLTPDSNGTYLVGFPDFPEANSVGDDKADALRNALDALETVLAVYFEAGRTIPLPSPAATGDAVITLAAVATERIFSWNESFVRV